MAKYERPISNLVIGSNFATNSCGTRSAILREFVEQYPTIQMLANADEKDVLRLWQGLGYYSRARNMHATAKIIANDFGGVFPNNYEGLLKLKGIGPYTAAAIASFAFDEKVAVVDGNVYRVLARVFGVETDISSHEAKKYLVIWQID